MPRQLACTVGSAASHAAALLLMLLFLQLTREATVTAPADPSSRSSARAWEIRKMALEVLFFEQPEDE